MHRVSPVSRAVASLRSWTGLQALRERQLSGGLILVYHGVAEKLRNDELDTYQITQSELRRHVRYLKSFADVIPVSDLLRQGEQILASRQRVAAITFDDALVSQVTLAADVMSELKVAWSIAVSAGLVEDQCPVWTNWVRMMTRFLSADDRPLIGGQSLDHAMLQNSGSRLIHHLMHHVTSAQRDQQIRELQESLGAEKIMEKVRLDGRFLTATWRQLSDVLGAGCEILSHGWSHRPHNSLICENDRVTEILESRMLIKRRLGIAPVVFAYPHGTTNEQSAALMEKSGYEFAVSTKASWFAKVDRWSVPRFDGEYSLNVLRRHLTWRR
jgi:peptidoglycan/xylan/chitin deacetylase (PgdA/CDA1 family)